MKHVRGTLPILSRTYLLYQLVLRHQNFDRKPNQFSFGVPEKALRVAIDIFNLEQV